jgi:ABC-type nitrate/sulfonate/bicarbonate transport system ATPase subunit
VKGFNLKLKKGEFVTVIGHSGCGKSTVLMMVAGLSAISARRHRAGRQGSSTAPVPTAASSSSRRALLPWMTAKENVMLGVEQVFFTADKEERTQIAEYYLTVVGLADSMDKRPGELSQACGSAWASPGPSRSSPRCSCSTSRSGCSTRSHATSCRPCCWSCGADKITAMMVTHDVDEALYLSDRVICMTDGPEAGIGDILEVNFPGRATARP